VPWVGPSMSVASMVTARIMETWAHSRDIRDGLGVIHPPTAALRHVAFLGYATRQFSYVNRGLEPDHTPLRLELVGPNREGWNFGPSEPGTQAVRGRAEDFCLVVTRRRHLDDTGLSVEPGPAREWMLIAQAFAGPQGSDPPRLPGPEAHKGQSELREEEMPRPS